MKPFSHLLIIFFIILLSLLAITACTTTSSAENKSATTMPEEGMPDTGHDEDMSEMETDHDHAVETRAVVPNNGAEVHITSPANEATFKASDSVVVTIETTAFTIGEDGNHWHIYLDGSPTMVMGGNTFVLQNLSVGPHDIEVLLSNGQHQDLEQGDKVTVLVEE